MSHKKLTVQKTRVKKEKKKKRKKNSYTHKLHNIPGRCTCTAHATAPELHLHTISMCTCTCTCTCTCKCTAIQHPAMQHMKNSGKRQDAATSIKYLYN